MRGVGRIHVSENQFRCGAGEIVFEFGGNERTAAGLGVQLEHLTARSGTERIAHADRPDPARNTRERDVFDIESAIQEEGESRTKLINWNSARSKHFRVGEPVRERVSSLLHRGRAGFTDVITTD